MLLWIEWLAATRKSAFDAPYRRLQDRCLVLDGLAGG